MDSSETQPISAQLIDGVLLEPTLIAIIRAKLQKTGSKLQFKPPLLTKNILETVAEYLPTRQGVYTVCSGNYKCGSVDILDAIKISSSYLTVVIQNKQLRYISEQPRGLSVSKFISSDGNHIEINYGRHKFILRNNKLCKIKFDFNTFVFIIEHDATDGINIAIEKMDNLDTFAKELPACIAEFKRDNNTWIDNLFCYKKITLENYSTMRLKRVYNYLSASFVNAMLTVKPDVCNKYLILSHEIHKIVVVESDNKGVVRSMAFDANGETCLAESVISGSYAYERHKDSNMNMIYVREDKDWERRIKTITYYCTGNKDISKHGYYNIIVNKGGEVAITMYQDVDVDACDIKLAFEDELPVTFKYV